MFVKSQPPMCASMMSCAVLSVRRWEGSFLRDIILAGSFGYPELVRDPWQEKLGRLWGRVPALCNRIGRGILFLDGRQRRYLLDVGCGTGAKLALMRRLGWEVAGVEPVQSLGHALFRRSWAEVAPPWDVCLWSPRALRTCVAETGFEIIRCGTMVRFDKWVQSWMISKLRVSERFNSSELQRIVRRPLWLILADLTGVVGSSSTELGDEILLIAEKGGG